MVKRVIPLLVVALFLVLAQFVSAAAPAGEGKLEGTLINRTSGSTSSVSDQPVVLNIYQGSALIDSKSTRSGSDGKYSFSGFSTDPGYVFEVAVHYEGADYYSDPLQYSANETAKTVDIEVNDTSTTDEGISIMLAHAVLSKNETGINVSQYYFIANTSDRTYIGKPSATSGGKNETIKLTMPGGATNLQIAYGLTDSDLIKSGNNLIDTAPLTPAGREISFSYRIPASANQLTWTFNYDVSRFDILTSDPTLKLTGDKLTAEQPLAISGKTYQDYSSSSLVAGVTVAAQISGGSSGIGNRSGWVWLILIPVVAIIAVVGVLAAKRKNKPVTAPTGGPITVDLKEKLLEEIAALDDDFSAGKVDEKEYNRLRAEKKRKLVTLMEIQAEVQNKKE